MHDEIVPPWKREILDNCRAWVMDLEETPKPAGGDLAEAPDLYSFYEQLCILGSAFRKNSRRTHELFSQFGEHLEEFQSVLSDLSEKTDRDSDVPDSVQHLARRGLLLQMAELYERLRLFSEKMATIGDATPKKTGWTERISGLFTAPSPVIPPSLREGFDLLLAHFHGFLESEGVVRLRIEGKPFDPAFMMAVGVARTDALPPGMVHEEISGGYLYDDQVIILAKVTVSKSKEK